MRILNEQDEELTIEQCDLETGYLLEETIIRHDAAPIDDVTKFAWADEDYETIQRYVAVPEKQRTTERIAQLKGFLRETDYAVIKIAEGAAAPEEYADVIAKRQAWRDEINELEVTAGGYAIDQS